ncbi:MAG TPA: YciI family protein [Candidatus Angelobacter sp.]|nr:YciI family protein [Candidatus Angelobacter sp.]
MAEQSNDYLYLFRGGADPKQMSPEQMQQNMNQWFAWIGDLRGKGKFKAGEPLGDEGKVLSGKKGQTVTDGPFVEGKEEVGGYLIVSAKDMMEAVEMARGCPIYANNGTVEVRPIQHIPGM